MTTWLLSMIYIPNPIVINIAGNHHQFHYHQIFTNTAQPLFLLLGSESFLESLAQAQTGAGGAPLMRCAG